MPGSSLADIKTKVRKLTYSPSLNELSDLDLENYINTFYVFDFPRELRTLDKRVNINILLNSYQQTYQMSDFLVSVNGVNLVYPNITNLQDWMTSIYNPVYVNGQQVQYTQSQSEFYNYYPKFNATDIIGTGTGAPVIIGTYTTQNFPLIPGTVNVTAQQADGSSVRYIDNFQGDFIDKNNQIAVGAHVDYFTGVITDLAIGSPANGINYYVNYLPYAASQPNIMLWFKNEIKFWPVPDKGYLCTFEADITFADLENDLSQPAIREWWQYIAYGAAKKVFEDRMDMQSVQMLMPELERQELLINRKFITQQSTNRVRTIYSNIDGMGPFINVASGNTQ